MTIVELSAWTKSQLIALLGSQRAAQTDIGSSLLAVSSLWGIRARAILGL
jgi:hypothetical protein